MISNRPRLLITDSDTKSLSRVKHIIEKYNYEIVAENSAVKINSYIKSENEIFDFILLDITIPGIYPLKIIDFILANANIHIRTLIYMNVLQLMQAPSSSMMKHLKGP